MSRTLKVIGNHIKFAVLLPVSEEAKNLTLALVDNITLTLTLIVNC